MKPRCDTLLRLTLSLIAFLALVLPTRGADDKKSAPDKTKSSQTNKYVRPTNPSLYLGADTCKTCHEEIYNNFATTPHVATTMEGKSIRGRSGTVVKRATDLAKLMWRVEATSARSLPSRTLRRKKQVPDALTATRIARNKVTTAGQPICSGVACIDCHSPHHAKAAEFLLKESPPKLCYGCHMDVRAVCKGPALSNELSIPAVLRRIRRTRVFAQS